MTERLYVDHVGRMRTWSGPKGYGDRIDPKSKPYFMVVSGPNYVAINKDKHYPTIEEARIEAARRPYWKYIINQARQVVERCIH